MEEPSMSQTIVTRAWIDDTLFRDGNLYIGGWAFAKGHVVDGFRVSCAGQVFDKIGVELGLPSPDVVDFLAKEFPEIPTEQFTRCRFYMRIPLSTNQQAWVSQ